MSAVEEAASRKSWRLSGWVNVMMVGTGGLEVLVESVFIVRVMDWTFCDRQEKAQVRCDD